MVEILISYDEYLKTFENHVGKYIPPKKSWSPVENAVYGPKDFFKTPKSKAEELRFNAIKYQFKNHYSNNKMYNGFCKEMKIKPEDIKTYEDLEKIPLVPGEFYKDYPSGKDFAHWLANIFTGEIPKVKINGKNPSFDEIVNSFNRSGLKVAYSSGTSGIHTVIPRDKKTFYAAEYAAAKAAISMLYPMWKYDAKGYLLMPNPFKTNVFAGKVCSIYFDAISEVKSAIDKQINADIIKLSMGGKGGLKAKIVKRAIQSKYKKIVKNIIKWIEYHHKKDTTITFLGAPFLLYAVTNKLIEQGKTFDFSDRGAIITGGGWKAHESKRMPVEEFREQMKEVLGIRPKHCIDLYGMVEGNGWMVHCPEGHYLHIPHTYYHALVLDDEFKPIGYNKWGRLAFLDGSTSSYPGFIISGDKVRMLERCPVCNRPGPVLEPEVTRAQGKEMRGCAEEVRRMISRDVGE